MKTSIFFLMSILMLLQACGDGPQDAKGQRQVQLESTVEPIASRGQVSQQKSAGEVTQYAATRFAEQVSFGATTSLVDEIRTLGFEKWIDNQFELSPSQIDISTLTDYPDPIPDEHWDMYRSAFPNLALSGIDQLRLRVTWALSQFLVTSDRKGDFVGTLYWINLLQKYGLATYDDLLYQISINPTMGQYLDNSQNRPKSQECPHCAPNENYARELMQLFSLGVNLLNIDGTPIKDEKGRWVETYTQKDVEELARALTGWTFNPDPPNRPNRNWANWGKPMVPSNWSAERDSGRKIILGETLPAGQSHEKDLRDVIRILMSHQNIAPFVATRLIQHLVKSNPSPSYVQRVSSAFLNNGAGLKGDMKAVVKAVLLDAEARAGDIPGSSKLNDGKFREPFLHTTAMWRGMDCRRLPKTNWGGLSISYIQAPFNAESVFSFYAPTDRAPGSNLLAPEQRLATTSNLRDRNTMATWVLEWNHETQRNSPARLVEASCDIDSLTSAFSHSPKAFVAWLSKRYFRGVMPATLDAEIQRLMSLENPPYNKNDIYEGPLRLLGYALLTPYFGVLQ